MQKKMIEFKDVVRTYGTGEALQKAADHVNFTVDEGEFVVILGQSGAGKSTVLNMLGCMDRPTQGTVIVDGETISGMNDKQLSVYRAEKIGFIFQFYNLIPNLTAKENVELMKDITDIDVKGDLILESVGLTGHGDQFPAQLSGGEQQRVSIARALAKEPAMLLCDEPTGALDSNTGVLILSLLQNKCHEKDTTVVIVTHNSKLADAADKLIRIKNGKIESVTVNENPLDVNLIEW